MKNFGKPLLFSFGKPLVLFFLTITYWTCDCDCDCDLRQIMPILLIRDISHF